MRSAMPSAELAQRRHDLPRARVEGGLRGSARECRRRQRAQGRAQHECRSPRLCSATLPARSRSSSASLVAGHPLMRSSKAICARRLSKLLTMLTSCAGQSTARSHCVSVEHQRACDSLVGAPPGPSITRIPRAPPGFIRMTPASALLTVGSAVRFRRDRSGLGQRVSRRMRDTCIASPVHFTDARDPSPSRTVVVRTRPASRYRSQVPIQIPSRMGAATVKASISTAIARPRRDPTETALKPMHRSARGVAAVIRMSARSGTSTGPKGTRI